MKTKLVIFAILSLFFMPVFAQDDKPVVYIEYFARPGGLDPALVEALRSKVIQGIQETNRVTVIDVASKQGLNSEEERRKAESAMGDVTARTTEMRTLGANYIITGDVASMTAAERKDDKGNISYKGSVHWSIKVIDAATGTLKVAKTFAHEGFTGNTGDSRTAAISSTCNYAQHAMDDLVDDAFPIAGLILKVETVNKKGAQTVIIDLGTQAGVVKGQKFTIYLEADMAGEMALTEIGSLNAQEILSGKRSICKVIKGGDKVVKAMNNEQKLVIVSRKARTIFDAL